MTTGESRRGALLECGASRPKMGHPLLWIKNVSISNEKVISISRQMPNITSVKLSWKCFIQLTCWISRRINTMIRSRKCHLPANTTYLTRITSIFSPHLYQCSNDMIINILQHKLFLWLYHCVVLYAYVLCSVYAWFYTKIDSTKFYQNHMTVRLLLFGLL